MILSFSDRWVWANSADQDQIARAAVWSGSTMFAIPSASFGRITLLVKLLAPILGWLQQIFLVSQFFRNFTAAGLFADHLLACPHFVVSHIWAAPWQNQQTGICTQWRQISLGIRPVWSVFALRMKKAWILSYPLSAQRRLIRLGGCPGWSESSLSAQSFCWFSHVAAHSCSSSWCRSSVMTFHCGTPWRSFCWFLVVF